MISPEFFVRRTPYKDRIEREYRKILYGKKANYIKDMAKPMSHNY